jgi:hypothetical protein
LIGRSDAAKQAIRNLDDAVARSPYKQRIDQVVMRWINFGCKAKCPA